MQLKSLTLDSISLTAPPRPAGQPLPGAAQAAILHNYYVENLASDSGESDDDDLDDATQMPAPPPVWSARPPIYAQARPPGLMNPMAPANLDMANRPELNPLENQSLRHSRDALRRLWHFHRQGLPVPAVPGYPGADTQPPAPNTAQSAATIPCSWTSTIDKLRDACLEPGHNRDIVITLLSCGYAAVHNGSDRSMLVDAMAAQGRTGWTGVVMHEWFESRREMLKDLVMTPIELLFASICPALLLDEGPVLASRHGMTEGWPGRELALGEERLMTEEEWKWGRWGEMAMKAVEYDGHRLGGTGRFSGRIQGFEPVEEDV